jgi:hypothetical protein
MRPKRSSLVIEESNPNAKEKRSNGQNPGFSVEGHLAKDSEKIFRIIRTWGKARRNREEKATIYKPQTVEAIRMAKTNKRAL